MRVGGCGVASCSEITKRGEKLLHFFLQHLISPLSVILGTLSVAQLYLRHGVLLPLLVQLFVEVHHFGLQIKVTLLQAAKESSRV